MTDDFVKRVTFVNLTNFINIKTLYKILVPGRIIVFISITVIFLGNIISFRIGYSFLN